MLPGLGRVPVARLHRAQLKQLLVAKLADGYARGYVKLIQSVVQTLFAAAVDDGVITANPADRLGRPLKLGRSVGARQDAIKAMTRAQLASFLAAAERVVPRLAPLLLLLARTGLRLGEALAFQWRDIDYADRAIHVARAFSGSRLETPKSSAGRTVDLSQQLCDRRLESRGRPRPYAGGGQSCSSCRTG